MECFLDVEFKNLFKVPLELALLSSKQNGLPFKTGSFQVGSYNILEAIIYLYKRVKIVFTGIYWYRNNNSPISIV